jgi:hypothetical protein
MRRPALPSLPLAPVAALPAGALAALAPPVMAGEAAAGWFVRLAFAHRLTVSECSSLAGVNPGALAASGADLYRLVALTGTTIKDFTPSSATQTTPDARPGTAAGWAVCRACLEADLQARVPPHIRRAWTHPLAGYCLAHEEPLVGHTLDDPFGQAFAECLDRPVHGDWRHLRQVCRQERSALSGLAVRLERPATPTLRRRTVEIADVAAALALSADFAMRGGVLDSAHQLWGLPPVRARAQRLDRDFLFTLDAADRLVFLRAALRILACPSKDLARPGSWLDGYLRLRGLRPERLRLGRVSGDPLLWLALQLAQHDAATLTMGAGLWRAGLQARWEAAQASARRILGRAQAPLQGPQEER